MASVEPTGLKPPYLTDRQWEILAYACIEPGITTELVAWHLGIKDRAVRIAATQLRAFGLLQPADPSGPGVTDQTLRPMVKGLDTYGPVPANP